MAYAKASLVQKIRHVLLDTPQVDNITAGYTAAGLTLTVADATLYDKGDILEFFSDNGAGTGVGDTFLVDSTSGTTITMKAAGLGWEGSTNVDHDSGDGFYLRPAFRYLQIVEAIDTVIQELWPYGWKAVSNTITPVSGQRWYDLATSTTNTMDLIDAKQLSSNDLDLIEYGTRKGPRVEIKKGLPTTLAASTVGVYFPTFVNTENTIAVRVRAKLTDTVSGGNYSDLDEGFLTDAVVYGAAARLVENTEIPRVTQTDVTEGDASVDPGARLRDAAYFRQLFDDKRRMLKRELEERIPRMPVWR